MELTHGEQKFLKDVNDLVIRALRAGATVGSVKNVLSVSVEQLEQSEPFIKAIAEKDLAP